MSVLLSNSMLAAALLLGQTTDPAPATGGTKTSTTSSVPPPPTIQQTQATQSIPAAAAPQQPRGPIMGWFTREDRPVMSKISSWFKREQPETPAQPVKGPVIRETATPPVTTPTTPPAAPPFNDFPRRLPNPSSKAATVPANVVAKETPPVSKDVIQAGAQQQPVELKNAKSPILPQFANKMGRDEKFEWITGQLEVENGVHVLYYATPETVDKLHGKIVLQPQQVDMKDLRRGDLVSVRGQLAQRQTTQGLTPVYRLTSANLIERPKS